MAAVKQDGNSLQYVKEQTTEICMAVNMSRYTFKCRDTLKKCEPILKFKTHNKKPIKSKCKFYDSD